MKIGSLILAALIVAPLSSCSASLAMSGMMAFSMPGSGGPTGSGEIAFVILFLAIMATIFSLLFMFAALLLLALPLTLLLNKLGAPAIVRDIVLLAVAGGAAALLYPVSAHMYEGQGWIFGLYSLAAALFWVAALRWIERRNRRASSAASAAAFQ